MSEDRTWAKRIDLRDVLYVLSANRRSIAAFTLVAAAMAMAVSMLLPPRYTAMAVLMPEIENKRGLNLGGLADLASLAGVGTAEQNLSKFLPPIINSERIASKVLESRFQYDHSSDSIGLFELWDIDREDSLEAIEDAVQLFRSRTSVRVDQKTNVATLSFEAESPLLAANIVASVIVHVDAYLRQQRRDNAYLQRQWIEGRMAQVQDSLTEAEEDLKNFRERNRVTASPGLMLEEARRIRKVQTNSTIFGELMRQYEIARIEEAKNIPIINVLDPPRPPSKKSFPPRRLIVFGVTLLAFFVILSFVYYREFLAKRVAVFLGGLRSSQHL